MPVDRAKLHKDIDDLSDEDLIELRKIWLTIRARKQQQGSPWAKELYNLFEPMRQDAVDSGMKSEEIDQLLDEELAEVRCKRKP